MKYSYYPGCSLHSSGRSYDKSLRAMFDRLDCQLVELDDWNCCGATAYMSVKETLSYAISSRNLALAEQAGLDLVVPCSACFCVLRKTKSMLQKVPELKGRIKEALAEGNLGCEFTVPVRHPLEVVITDVGVEEIVKRQKRGLQGWKVACYYGCQILRPESALANENPEEPQAMERLFQALGAEPIYYPPKARCCGGMLIATKEDIAQKLCNDLVSWARRGDACCIATTCPLCQTNLDMVQDQLNGRGEAIPVLYFTQLLAFALGCDMDQLGLEHHLVSPSDHLRNLLETAA